MKNKNEFFLNKAVLQARINIAMWFIPLWLYAIVIVLNNWFDLNIAFPLIGVSDGPIIGSTYLASFGGIYYYYQMYKDIKNFKTMDLVLDITDENIEVYYPKPQSINRDQFKNAVKNEDGKLTLVLMNEAELEFPEKYFIGKEKDVNKIIVLLSN